MVPSQPALSNANPRIRPIEGMVWTVPGLSVPPAAVFAIDGKDFVSGVDAGKIVRRPVQVGLRTAEAVEIQSGLSEHDVIVAATPAAFSPGQTIKVERKGAAASSQ